MTTPKVTVLMSVYNGEKYLREAINSIVRQTFTNFEFLIINDGSTDNSVCIIQSYYDSRIRLIQNNGNLGLAISLNRGLELAQGELVARMDADDVSRPERLARQVNFMDSNPQVGVCGSWVQFFPRDNNGVWKLPETTEEIRCLQFHTVGVAHPSVMMRNKFFADNGLLYDPLYRFSQDFELWGRAIKYMDFANIQEVLLDYRINSGQTCSQYGSEQLAAVAPIRRQRVRELGLEPTREEHLLHETIMNSVTSKESAFLDRVERWLLRLESANRSNGVYPANYFSRILLDLWFATCINHTDVSPGAWKQCLQSSLWSAANTSTWCRLRAFGAWAIRRGVSGTMKDIWHV